MPTSPRFRAICLGSLLLTAACHKESGAPGPKDSGPVQKVVGMVTDVGGRGDQSFNDSALRGLELWAAGDAASIQKSLPEDLAKRPNPIVPLGVKPVVVQSKNPEDYEPNLQLLVDQGVDLTVANGFMLENALETVAKRNPDARFLLVDTPLADANGKPITLPNVRTVVFRENEGSFLAGALAAYASQSGKVGFVGGMDLPLIQRFEVGFRAGAEQGRPDRKMEVIPSYTGNFDNVASGKQVAQDLIGRGVDVLFHAAGTDGLGVIQAVKEARAAGKKVWVIGCDSDQFSQAPQAVLSSMVKHADLAVYETVRDLTANKFTAGDLTWGLAEQGVGLTPVRVEFPGKASALARIAQLERQIASGSLRVPSRRAELETPAPGQP